ncbi:MAG: hypothetical protein ACKOZV_13100 [Bacteroidota bacterium]
MKKTLFFTLILVCWASSASRSQTISATVTDTSEGWQFVQAYAEPYSEGSFIHWILRKKK